MKPDLAIDFHNDASGPIIFETPLTNPDGYTDRMKKLEKLLREMTWFRELAIYRPPGGGMSERYGTDWLVYELNAGWAEGLKKGPLSDDWKLLGRQLCRVFDVYFKTTVK